MSKTEQTKGLSVLEHGIMVNDFYIDLYDHIITGQALKNSWKLPIWINNPLIKKTMRESDIDLISLYQVYHDCGKPYCLTIDDDGRRHFPDHASVSYDTYLKNFGMTEYHQKVAKLIKDDMQIHLLKDEGVDAFIKNENALLLLLTGLAEIHANADMFGGIESVSFKIKWKQINKRGNAILKKLNKLGELK